MPAKTWDVLWTFDYKAWCNAVFVKRCEEGMTQKEFGALIGVSHSVLAKIEAYRWVSLPTLIIVSQGVCIDLNSFVKR